MKRYCDSGSIIVIIITFILFVMALFTKGLTHDIFLETGVFLISVKIILLTYKSNIFNHTMEKKIEEIKELLEKK